MDFVPACRQQIERLVCAQYCRVKVVLVAVPMYIMMMCVVAGGAAAAAVNRFATNLVNGRTKTVMMMMMMMMKERVDMKQSRR